MTKKADFNAEEWTTVVEVPLLAGLRVVAAERGGTIRESLAMGKVYAEARRQQGQSELLDDLAATPPAVPPADTGVPVGLWLLLAVAVLAVGAVAARIFALRRV